MDLDLHIADLRHAFDQGCKHMVIKKIAT